MGAKVARRGTRRGPTSEHDARGERALGASAPAFFRSRARFFFPDPGRWGRSSPATRADFQMSCSVRPLAALCIRFSHVGVAWLPQATTDCRAQPAPGARLHDAGHSLACLLAREGHTLALAGLGL